MFDIKYIVENADLFRVATQNKHMPDVVSNLVLCYEKGVALQQELELMRQKRSVIAKKTSQATTNQEREKLIEAGKELKQNISDVMAKNDAIQDEIQQLAKRIPNIHHADVPIGKHEKDNLVIKKYGTPSNFEFAPKDHIELATLLDIVDFERASTVVAPKFYYLKNKGVILELALLRFGMDILVEHGFTLFQTPDLAKTSIVESIGFMPRGNESNIYNIEDEDLSLIGTAEITLGGYYANSILTRESLPIKIAGVSHCFRRESGAAGQYSKGLYRVHQFTKLEMFAFCTPDVSNAMHEELLGIEEIIYQKLRIPYRVVDTCTGDLGASAYRKFDIEAWMPGRGNGEYGEVTSTSNCTDYQARRLGIRMQYKDEMGKKQRVFPHMLNGTALAIPRTIIAILENFQNSDGSVQIPEALIPYCGFSLLSAN